MRRYALQRLALGVVQIALLAVLVFLLTSLLPGDAADVRNNEDAGAEQVAALREQLRDWTGRRWNGSPTGLRGSSPAIWARRW